MNIGKISYPTINFSQKVSSANKAVGNFFGRTVTHIKNGACKTAQTVKNAFFAIGRGFQVAGKATCNAARKVTTSISTGIKSVANKVSNAFARIFKKEKKSAQVEKKQNTVLASTNQDRAVARENGLTPVVVVNDQPVAAPVVVVNDEPVAAPVVVVNDEPVAAPVVQYLPAAEAVIEDQPAPVAPAATQNKRARRVAPAVQDNGQPVRRSKRLANR